MDSAISVTLLSTLDKLSSSPRHSSSTTTSGVASPGTGVSTELEWPADSCDELESIGSGFDLNIFETKRSLQASPELCFSPAPGLTASPALSAFGLSPAPGLTPAPPAWPNTPEFTPLIRPLDGPHRTPLARPFDLGRSAISASPEQFPSTPEMSPMVGPLDLGPTAAFLQELPALEESDAELESSPSHSTDGPPGSLQPPVVAQQAAMQATLEQYAAAQQAAMFAWMQMGYQPLAWPMAPLSAVPMVAPQPAAAKQEAKGDKPLILAKPSKDFNEPAPGVPRTTLLLRNMPNNQTRKMLMELLDKEGFASEYDFLYLPMDFQSRTSMGYAFVNFTSEEAASRAKAAFDGYKRWRIPSRKVCGVSWSHPHQGYEAHVERYRNSPVMHEDVPDNYKPVILNQGKRVAFPEPTLKIKAPRQRGSKVCK